MSPWSIAQTRQAELMDDPALAEADHLHALVALARINTFSGTASRIAHAISRLLASGVTLPRRLHVVDVACGGGDVTVALARQLARLLAAHERTDPGVEIHVTGVDVSPRAIARSTAFAARAGVKNVSFETIDVVTDGCPACDVATSSLFLHHLDDGAALRLLRSMAQSARRGLVISDLLRSGPGLLLAILGTTVLSTSRIARVDGPRSVRAARTPDEYRRLLDRAGLANAKLQRVWPERTLIEWIRSPEWSAP